MKLAFICVCSWFTICTAIAQRSGVELAKMYCASCHLFPEPSLLDRSTWMNHALKQMAPFLGVGKVDLSRRPDGAILERASVFPKEPLISREDWAAIIHYYRENSPAELNAQPKRARIRIKLPLFRPHAIKSANGSGAICLVQIDQKRREILSGNWAAGTLDILDEKGIVQRSVALGSAPVGVVERGGRFYATQIGRIFPSDELAAKVISFGSPAPSSELVRVLVENVPRSTDLQIADLNKDGRDDLILCMFGNRLGRFSWFEHQGTNYVEHLLLDRPGAVRSAILDANNDGLPDIIVMMAQAREGIYLFRNQGKGGFRMEPIIEQHPVFGFSYFELADFNHDGFPDILATNGDNGEYPSPMKNYHGIRIYVNDGQYQFTERYFFPLNGAFKAVARDFDLDGDLDMAAISFFPDYQRSPEESFVYLENQGNWTFDAASFDGSTKGRWLTMDAGDLDGDGDQDLVLGSFAQGPVSIPIDPRIQKDWSTNAISLMLLENELKKAK